MSGEGQEEKKDLRTGLSVPFDKLKAFDSLRSLLPEVACTVDVPAQNKANGLP